ncbi:MAG: HEAT repeat domain-containing protein [Deinococcus sp.]|nr:HEAT repeat domain-containing protein [Deinococcus sp.]
MPVCYPTGNGKLPLAQQRFLIEEAALQLWLGMEGSRQLTFGEKTVLEALKSAVRAEGYTAPAEVAGTLLGDLRDNSGLLRGKPGGDYFFLHLTLQELLVAGALARRVNDRGWKKARVPRADGQAWTVAALVDHKAWDPAWQEVIALLAGRLKDPRPLLVLLADPSQDDLFRHRLAVAAHALAEAGSQKAGEQADKITRALFPLWEHEAGRGVLFPHWSRALPALVQAGVQVDGLPLPDRLALALSNANQKRRRAAARALEAVGAMAATPAVLEALLDASFGSNRTVRSLAADALGAMGEAVALPEVLEILVEALRDPAGPLRGEAAWALGEMGKKAAPPQVVEALLPVLGDPDEGVRWLAAEALGKMEVAIRPEILGSLLQALGSPDKRVRRGTAAALGVLGEAVVIPQGLEALLQGLEDPDEEVRVWAAGALESIFAQGVRVFRCPSGLKILRVEELALRGSSSLGGAFVRITECSLGEPGGNGEREKGDA